MPWYLIVHSTNFFIDATLHLYKRSCQSVCPSICLSVRLSFHLSIHPSDYPCHLIFKRGKSRILRKENDLMTWFNNDAMRDNKKVASFRPSSFFVLVSSHLCKRVCPSVYPLRNMMVVPRISGPTHYFDQNFLSRNKFNSYLMYRRHGTCFFLH